MFSAEVLKESGRASKDSPGDTGCGALVVGQIALAVVLLTAPADGSHVHAMRQVQPAARPAEVETSSSPSCDARRRWEAGGADLRTDLRALQQIPVSRLSGSASSRWMGAQRGPSSSRQRSTCLRLLHSAGWRGIFRAMENPIIAGRSAWTDIHQLRPLAVISENLAPVTGRAGEGRWPSDQSFANEPWQEIVGVVGNERAGNESPTASAGLRSRQATNRPSTAS